MRGKLAHAERVLEALMTSDAELLEAEADALSRVTSQPGWAVLTTPEYVRYSIAFVNATTDLVNAARDRDFDAAAMHYQAMTMTCYQCHRYLKNARIANAEPGDGDGQAPARRRAGKVGN